MPTKIYLVTRSTRYKSLSTYEKSIDEICAFETLCFYSFVTFPNGAASIISFKKINTKNTYKYIKITTY